MAARKLPNMKELKRLPNIFGRVIQLPVPLEAYVALEECAGYFSIVAETEGTAGGDFMVRTLKISPGITKTFVSAGEFFEDDNARWMWRLPDSAVPELAVVTYLHGKLNVIIPKKKVVEEKNAPAERLKNAEAARKTFDEELKRFVKENVTREEIRQSLEDEVRRLTQTVGQTEGEKREKEEQVARCEAYIDGMESKLQAWQKVVEEKNAPAKRLKSAEAASKTFDEELKRFATENVTREEIRQSLEDEVRRLTQTVGQTEGEKREMEEQVARCEAYIDSMESKLQACQQYIHTLEASLQEEMSRHAPLYGAGLEALSMKELETLSLIHEEGQRQIHALQQRKGSPAGSPLLSPHALPHNHELCHAASPPMAVGLPPSIIPNGIGIHGNGHVNGAVGPWFNHP